MARNDEARGRGRRSRVVLTPRRWRQVGGDASHRGLRRRQQSPIAGKSAKETVKTIRVRECRTDPVDLW
jgi:hypothetical protein